MRAAAADPLGNQLPAILWPPPAGTIAPPVALNSHSEIIKDTSLKGGSSELIRMKF